MIVVPFTDNTVTPCWLLKGSKKAEDGYGPNTDQSACTHCLSTKDRQDLIDTNIEPRLYSYLGGIARKMESRLLDAGGTANHVHLLISQSKNIALATLLEELKKSSSIWMKQQGREYSKFKWQDGYIL